MVSARLPGVACRSATVTNKKHAAEVQKRTPATRIYLAATRRRYCFTFTSAVRMAVRSRSTAYSFNPPPANKS